MNGGSGLRCRQQTLQMCPQLSAVTGAIVDLGRPVAHKLFLVRRTCHADLDTGDGLRLYVLSIL